MIVIVLILSFIIIIFVIFSSNNYIFAQHIGDETILTLEEQLELAKSKILTKGTNGTAERENNEVAKHEWKTCLSELGFSIEYPYNWTSKKELENTSLTEYGLTRMEHLNSKYNWLDIDLVDKIQKFLEQSDYSYSFPQIGFNNFNYVDSCFLFDSGPSYTFTVFAEPAEYNSIKVLTRISFLDLYQLNEVFKIVYPLGDGLSNIEKPIFDKYIVDGEKTGSYIFKRLAEWEKILAIHNNTLYVFEIMLPLYDYPNSEAKEEDVEIKKHMINSIRWSN